ncbi:hypothetical protein TSUD_177190 [Trifolium subterraneum]|uniref:DUF674 family protein n=1 Tax=Trifolium subterraneum TaxID=3900 RepID=A0A2Z6NZY0_TRISU|nr:hypothetical protein TSUD_177190 [Trifolium subterraneum]
MSRFLNFDVENSTNIQISVKLVMRKSDGRILYAQGEEDFADMLLSFLTFPLGGIVRKLKGNCSLDENRTHEKQRRNMLLVNTSGNQEGYFKGLKMYVATDDLVIAQSSPISSLNLINISETSLDDLKEKVVTIGVEECLSILMAALTSTSALTNGLAHLLTEVKEEK